MYVESIASGDFGICVDLNFKYDDIKNYPIFIVEDKDKNLEIYYLYLTYCHFSEVFIKVGDSIPASTIIGIIGNNKFNTELHDQRGLKTSMRGINLNPESHPCIPYKLTLSIEEGEWIESLINEFNNQ